MLINVLCVGDIVGRPGRRVLADNLKKLITDLDIDCVIANAENAAGGSGLTPQIYRKLLRYGVNLVTLGDHVYRKKEIVEVLETADNIVRPANLSDYAAGRTTAVYKTSKGPTVGISSLLGRIFMKPANCPYSAADRLVARLKDTADAVFIDFHAEATSEKLAMGYHIDGRVSCCFGTHTHVATADERVLSGGTAYITDIGMTGPHESILGRKAPVVLKSFVTRMPFPFEVATDDVQINAILVTVDANTGRAERIERIKVKQELADPVSYDQDDGKPEYFTEI